MSIATQMTINDGMTSKLNKITAATEKTNKALKETNQKSEQAAASFSKQAQAIKQSQKTMSETGVTKSEALKRAWDEVGKNINAPGLDEFDRKQNKIKKGAEGIGDTWKRVKSCIASAVTAIGVQKVIDVADTLTTTRARADLMNDGRQTTDELQSMIMVSANRSRAAYQTTADAVTKMGIMAKDAFGSNAELIKFTELINKQFTIAGTSVAGIDAAMLQLTQAMSSGVLRGEELNSIFDQAPTIIQSIADYLNVPIGQIKTMAAEGKITSVIVKNAMLESADKINAKFESMPMTFAQVWTIAKNIALEACTPVIQAIGAGAQWIYDNWSTIAPVFWGAAGAVAAYAAALGIQTVATWIANGAAKAFFITLMTNPLFWIAVVIGVVVAAIYKMISAVGGLKNAWEICKASLVVAWSALKVAFYATYNWVANIIDKLKLCWQKAGTAIADFMGNMKVSVLEILQNLINGAINIINDFITLLNKIPGVNIGLIEQVTFATTAAAENEAAKQARAEALKQYESDIKAAQEKREDTYNTAKKQLADATDKLTEIYKNSKSETAQKNTDDIVNVDRVNSVGSIENDINIAKEDLKFLRDVAEMRYVQNFVTLTPTVAVEAQINEKVDVDEVVERIEYKLETEFEAVAEGVYN